MARPLDQGTVLAFINPRSESLDYSLCLDTQKRIYWDLENESNKGDMWNLIAYLLDIKKSNKHWFRSVLKALEQATGLKVRRYFTKAKYDGELKEIGPVDLKEIPFCEYDQDRQVIENYYVFYEDRLPEFDRDLFSGELMTKIEGSFKPVLNFLPMLKSDAFFSNDLKASQLENHLAKLKHELTPKFLIKFPPLA